MTIKPYGRSTYNLQKMTLTLFEKRGMQQN